MMNHMSAGIYETFFDLKALTPVQGWVPHQ